MVRADYIESLITKLKNAISKEMDNDNYDMALSLISVCATILYQTNIRYTDNDLEQSLADVGKKLVVNKLQGNSLEENTVLFWDGFGVNDRGLALIYIQALCKVKQVVYVTYQDRKNHIPDIQDVLKRYGAKECYIKRNKKSNIDMIRQLSEVIVEVKPKHFFFYSLPDDVVAPPLLYAYKGILKRYQVNLTDHAYWLGAGCCDKCINFRAYGAKVSKEYRNISEDKNVVIPFYPVIHKDREFQGFPFDIKAGQKVVFSGGALYKTISDDNRYYAMIEHILQEHQDVIFWYAGKGDDTELKKILSKYPERAFHTEERSDLFQLFEQCNIYLSTYPMCGGLMFQYAAMAGIVPVTLKYGNISDEFLINQKDINVEFETEEELYGEIDRLLSDSEYAAKRGELMKKSVISADVFEMEVKKLVEGQDSDAFKPLYEHIDTENFRSLYLTRFSNADIDAMIVRRNVMKAGIRHCPFEFMRGGGTSCVGDSYETAVIVLTYEPVISKLWFTLDSIMKQKYENFEVIVSDDGSKEKYFIEVVKYFERRGFTDYSIVFHERNVGTVRNALDAVNVAESRYVKLISPGDALVADNTMALWTEYLKKSGRKWSFGDALYYRRIDEQIEFIERPCNPQIVDCYIGHDDVACRMNYVVCKDYALGAAILCDRKLLLGYLKEIVNQVIYAEDLSYRIMMFDNILPEYYPQYVIIYEYGCGVSTAGNAIWGERLRADAKNSEKIMLARHIKDGDILQRKIVNIYKRKYGIGSFKRFGELVNKEHIRLKLVRRFKPRTSVTRF